MNPSLLNYFRSSASYRVRIALNLKGLPYDYVPVHLTRHGGEQFTPGFRRRNPQALVPVYDDGQACVAQSLAIIEYLDERHPEIPLLPNDLYGRARVRQLSLIIACDIHPLHSLRVLKYLIGPLGLSEDAKNHWIQHWIALGLNALETELTTRQPDGAFCYGDRPTMADCCLVPQLFGARRFGIDVERYERLAAIERACAQLSAFTDAAPEVQPDAE